MGSFCTETLSLIHIYIVVGVPDSSLSAAMGYAEASGLPYEMGLIKNKYIGRTFIQPSQELREKGVIGRTIEKVRWIGIILRAAFGAVIIHLLAAVGAVQKAGQRIRFAQRVDALGRLAELLRKLP